MHEKAVVAVTTYSFVEQFSFPHGIPMIRRGVLSPGIRVATHPPKTISSGSLGVVRAGQERRVGDNPAAKGCTKTMVHRVDHGHPIPLGIEERGESWLEVIHYELS